MKIFICWSGPLSKAVALQFRSWINDVLQLAEPWMSQEDIPSGSIWFDGINKELEQTKYGVICVTQKNQTAPWLLWEAGALFGGIQNGRRREVVPLLIDLGKGDLISPLDKFQARLANNKKDMLRMLTEMNGDMESSLSKRRLEDQFDRCWDEWKNPLLKAIESIPDVRVDDSSQHTFGEVADKFLRDKKIPRYRYGLKWVRQYLDALPVDQVDDNRLTKFKEDRLAGTIQPPPGVKPPPPAKLATLHKEIQLVSQVVKMAKQLGWIDRLPTITQVPRQMGRKQYILTWDEQDRLFKNLPEYVRQATLFAINTGAQRGLICDLEWSWLATLPGLEIPHFQIPIQDYGRYNGRIILLNSVARRVVREQRKLGNDRYVFPSSRGGKINIPKPFTKAWKRANLPVKGGHALGVSNLVWTFENRLEQAGVGLEDREILLWRGTNFRKRLEKQPDYRHLLDCLERVATRPPIEEVKL